MYHTHTVYVQYGVQQLCRDICRASLEEGGLCRPSEPPLLEARPLVQVPVQVGPLDPHSPCNLDVPCFVLSPQQNIDGMRSVQLQILFNALLYGKMTWRSQREDCHYRAMALFPSEPVMVYETAVCPHWHDVACRNASVQVRMYIVGSATALPTFVGRVSWRAPYLYRANRVLRTFQ